MTNIKTKGFTLIELVIVVTIIGLLAAIAIPSYQSYVRKARRSDAIVTLVSMQAQQEKFRASQDEYVPDPDISPEQNAQTLGAPADNDAASYYIYTIENSGASSYTLVATAKSGSMQSEDKQSGTPCSELKVTQSNVKTPANCWQK